MSHLVPFHKIPVQLYKTNRNKVLKYFNHEKRSAILLKGGNMISKYGTDREYKFDQESNFRYIFGMNLANCYGVLHINPIKSIVFVEDDANNLNNKLLYGDIVQTMNKIKKNYGIDEIFFVSQMYKYLTQYGIEKIYTLDSPNDPMLDITKLEPYVIFDNKKLKKILIGCRVIKSKYEIDLMRFINKITSLAHTKTIQESVPGMFEFQLESLFLHYILSHGGFRRPAYMGICASGRNSSILHYTNNNKKINKNDWILMDMGGQYYGYAADITTTFPITGIFTPNQYLIYNIVLEIFYKILKLIKPGVNWNKISDTCNRLLAESLLNHNFIKGSLNEIINNKICYFFMPHRLAHFIGLDVHDVGELYDEFYILKPGMILAVEPALYFNEDVIKFVKKNNNINKFFNFKKINKFIPIGGVRIESNILITDDGIEEFTQVPR